MTFVHGKNTSITLDANDLSAFVTTSQFERTQDSHDVTTYGQTGHVYKGGLTDGTATMSGIYDSSTSAGPRAKIEPLIVTGSTYALVRRPEGAGTGKPQTTAQVLPLKYVETSPVADMVTWSLDMQVSGAVTTGTQT